jgi:hypothetical protein
MSDDTRSFLERWSRRKAAVRRGEPLPEQVEETAPETEASEAAASCETAPAEPSTEVPVEEAKLELPDIDSLDVGSDFKIFMRKEVPEALRKKALRKLWRVNPIINRHDGLDDYCGDYTDSAVAAKGVKTLYQVGRGMVAQVEEVVEKVSALEPASLDAVSPAPRSVTRETDGAAENADSVPSEDDRAIEATPRAPSIPS